MTESSSPTVSLSSHLKRCTIFQWNARGLRSKLGDLRQLLHTYRFPFVVISESRVDQNFRLSGYYFIHSQRVSGTSRLLIGFRTDVPAVEIPVSPHETNEYVCATTIIGSQTFTFIAAYLQPNAKFDETRLDNLITSTDKPHIICGDFNAHNEIWGSSQTSLRGAKLADLLIRHGIEPLNDGSITFLKSPKTTSCIDLSFVTAGFSAKFTWCTDLETRGSDHYPILISTRDSHSQTYKEQVACTDWRAFVEAIRTCITAATRDDEIIPAILHCFRNSTCLRTKR